MKNIFTLFILITSISMGTLLSEEEEKDTKMGSENFNKVLVKSTVSQDT